MQRIEISDELRRAGVAASTIRQALGPWIASERDRIIAELVNAPATMEALLKIKADAGGYAAIKRQLETAMINAGVPYEKI